MTYQEAIGVLSDPETNLSVWEDMVMMTSNHVRAIELALEALGKCDRLERALKVTRTERDQARTMRGRAEGLLAQAQAQIADLEIRLKAAKDGRLNILRGYQDDGCDL